MDQEQALVDTQEQELVVAGGGGAGSTCCSGAGGYGGGGGPLSYGGVNGGEGGPYNRGNNGHPSGWGSPGGYYVGSLCITKSGTTGSTLAEIYGGMSAPGWWDGHQPGNGGTGGKGGIVSASAGSKIYAFNGNRYTDGTSYNEGANEAVIYYQFGVNIRRGYTLGRAGNSGDDYLSDFDYPAVVDFIETNAQSFVDSTNERTKVNPTGYENTYFSEHSISSTVTINDLLTNADLKYQGIGSGAGYVEESNGTYVKASS